MSDDQGTVIPLEIKLRPIDRKRLDSLQERTGTALSSDNIWYIHTVLAQCFLPYKDPKTHDWIRKNGDFSIALMSGHVEDPRTQSGMRIVGLPFGAKPRLFQSYANTQAIKQQSPVIPVERSMTAMLKELGYNPIGGKRGNIGSFKEQITRFAACHFTIVSPGTRGTRQHIKASPIKSLMCGFQTTPMKEYCGRLKSY